MYIVVSAMLLLALISCKTSPYMKPPCFLQTCQPRSSIFRCISLINELLKLSYNAIIQLAPFRYITVKQLSCRLLFSSHFQYIVNQVLIHSKICKKKKKKSELSCLCVQCEQRRSRYQPVLCNWVWLVNMSTTAVCLPAKATTDTSNAPTSVKLQILPQILSDVFHLCLWSYFSSPEAVGAHLTIVA